MSNSTSTSWSPVMIKTDVKEKLQEIMKREGITSLSKAVEYLIQKNEA